MNIYSISSLIAFVVCFFLGLFVYFKSKEDFVKKMFSVGTIFIGIWTSFPFLMGVAKDEIRALLFARILYLAAAFVPSMFLHFMLVFANKKLTKRRKNAVLISYIISSIFFVNSFNPLFIRGIKRFSPYFSVIPGPLYIYFALSFVAMGAYSFLNFFRALLNSTGYRRNQLRYVLIAILCAFASGIMHFSAAYINWEPFPHDLLVVFYPCLMAYAIVKHHILDIKIVITRTGIFVVVYTLVLGLPFLLLTLGKNWLIQFLGTNWWVGPLILLTVLATAGPFFYIYLQKRAEAILLREQLRYRETLRQAAREMARIHNLRKLLSLIVHTVTKTVRLAYAAIYLFNQKSDAFILETSRGLKKIQPPLINSNNGLIQWLKENKEPLVYEEVVQKSQEQKDSLFKTLEDQMRFLNASLIVPGFLDEKLIGILILGDKRSGKMYTLEDLNTFSLLANQAALAIENALLYENIEGQVRQRTEELIQVQKQLVQAEKLATVGTLAGGVAHEINNPLTAILTNAQMLLAGADTLDADTKESLQLIEEATQRCRTIVQKLMTYAKKPLESAEVSGANMLKVVKKVITFLIYQLEQENVKIVIKAKEDNYPVMGNSNELEQVITNLVLNARDAIKSAKKSGSVQIALAQDDEWVKLQIKDDGRGIPKEILSRVFDPFFTTKEIGKGLGLGLSICHSIVERYNGLITVQSEENKGSVFMVQLPKAKVESISKV